MFYHHYYEFFVDHWDSFDDEHKVMLAINAYYMKVPGLYEIYVRYFCLKN